jgi:hypothetical protein
MQEAHGGDIIMEKMSAPMAGGEPAIETNE